MKKLKKLQSLGAFAVTILLGCHFAHAQTIPVGNNSFEADVIGAGDFVPGASVTDWTITGERALFYPFGAAYGWPGTPPLPAPASGNQYLVLYDDGGTATQAVGTISGNLTYTLTVAIGNRVGSTFLSNYNIQLLANGVAMTPTTSVLTQPTPGIFVDDTVTYNIASDSALIGDTLSIELSEANSLGGGGGAEVGFDNAQLTEAPISAPEPKVALLLLGGLGLLLVSRLRRRQNV